MAGSRDVEGMLNYGHVHASSISDCLDHRRRSDDLVVLVADVWRRGIDWGRYLSLFPATEGVLCGSAETGRIPAME